MITRKELNPAGIILTKEQEANFEKLFIAMNKIRALYGKPMIVTSGVRTQQMQMRINPSNPHSAHLAGAAVDINDPDKDLWGWCLDNINIIIECGLYLENRLSHSRHTHFQILPPKSGSRIFNP